MKKINKIAIAGLSIALLTNMNVFAKTKSLFEENNSNNIISESSLRSSSLDYKNLPEGVYRVNMKIMNASKRKSKYPSMMNEGVIDKKVVVDSNGKYWLHITMKKIKKSIILNGKNQTFEGYMEELKYYDENNKLHDSIVLSNYEENGVKYPKEVKFPIPNPNEKIQKIKIQIFAGVMNKIKEGMGIQDAMPTIDWNEFTKIN